MLRRRYPLGLLGRLRELWLILRISHGLTVAEIDSHLTEYVVLAQFAEASIVCRDRSFVGGNLLLFGCELRLLLMQCRLFLSQLLLGLLELL